MKRTGFKKKATVPLKRTKLASKPRKLRTVSNLPSSKLKKLIQAKLRENAIARDKECVLRQYEELLPTKYLECGPFRKDGQVIVQAEHLVGRSNSQCYADMENIVLICQRHHFYFKPQHGALYWHIIRKIIGEERWEKVQAWEADKSPHRMFTQDWRDALERLNTKPY